MVRVPKRLTSQPEHKIPLIEPIDKPNKTIPIPEVETSRVSRIAGVRVTHDAITKPGRKKKVNRAQVRSFKAFLCVAAMKDDQ